MRNTPDVSCSWQFSNKVRVGVSLVCGILAALASATLPVPVIPILVGWDAFALTYIVWVGQTAFRLHRDTTAGLASSEDPDRLFVDLLMVLASLASLGGVGWGL